jgi:hypothetical protein
MSLSEREKEAILDLEEGQLSDEGYFVIKSWIRCYYSSHITALSNHVGNHKNHIDRNEACDNQHHCLVGDIGCKVSEHYQAEPQKYEIVSRQSCCFFLVNDTVTVYIAQQIEKSELPDHDPQNNDH